MQLPLLDVSTPTYRWLRRKGFYVIWSPWSCQSVQVFPKKSKSIAFFRIFSWSNLSLRTVLISFLVIAWRNELTSIMRCTVYQRLSKRHKPQVLPHTISKHFCFLNGRMYRITILNCKLHLIGFNTSNFNFVGKTHENKSMDEMKSDCSWKHTQNDFDTSYHDLM